MKEDFLKEGKRMTNEEIKAHFKKDSTSRKGSYELETERLREAIYDHAAEWSDKAIRRFLDSDPGKAFLAKHKGKKWQEVFKIFERETNYHEGLSREVVKKIDELRGKVV